VKTVAGGPRFAIRIKRARIPSAGVLTKKLGKRVLSHWIGQVSTRDPLER